MLYWICLNDPRSTQEGDFWSNEPELRPEQTKNVSSHPHHVNLAYFFGCGGFDPVFHLKKINFFKVEGKYSRGFFLFK
jgi:hypothetical protein